MTVLRSYPNNDDDNNDNVGNRSDDVSDNWFESTWVHVAWLATGSAMVLIALTKSMLVTARSRAYLGSTSAVLVGYVLVDLVSGIYHWAIDNYGTAETPILGPQIEAFQSHHQQPWGIAKRQVANNLYVSAVVTSAVVFPVNVWCCRADVLAFVGVFMGLGMLCQQFHAWAHTPKGKLLTAVVALQGAGIILGREEHAAHHRPPYDKRYCIVSGMWNRVLDRYKIFMRLEIVIFYVLGVRPLSWSVFYGIKS